MAIFLESESRPFQNFHVRDNYQIHEYKPVLLRRTGPRGEFPGKEMSYAPRSRGLVIGISYNDDIIVGYPYENVATQGYWTYPLFDIMDLLGEKLYTVMKGRIGGYISQNGKIEHILAINKIPKDVLPNYNLVPREIGLSNPEAILTPDRSERILRGINAQKLVITEHEIATKLCGYLK